MPSVAERPLAEVRWSSGWRPAVNRGDFAYRQQQAKGLGP
jgi:hypothetical protein